MAKKKNSRKALAVALGIMGIAGLSVASASQLDITTSPSDMATGTQTFAAACDDAVAVKYNTTTNATTGAVTYTGYTVSGIADLCRGKTLVATVGYSTYSAGPPVAYTAAPARLASGDVTIPTGAAGDNPVTVTFSQPGSTRLDNIAITIS